MKGRPRFRQAAEILGWLALLAVITVALAAVQTRLDKAHMALAYLLLVLFGSSRGGRVIGLGLAVLSFLSFNYFLLPPHYTFRVHDQLDWLVLIAYLVTAIIGAELLDRAQRQARAANLRAEEIDRLYRERERLLAETERVEALREADRLKDALMAAVSHDLRTPLTTIKALGHEILRDGDDRAALLVEEADRLNRVVTDLLDLSRLNSGGLPLKVELNPADDLVAAAVQQTAGILGDHELVARIPDTEVLAGRFDPVHSVRALANLIENAAKYSPPGLPIELTLTRADALLRVTVEDRGPGVPPEEVERVFQPFVRLDPRTHGSGLGLSIARRLAEAQGGRIRYEHRAGGGSRFVLELPAADLPDWEE